MSYLLNLLLLAGYAYLFRTQVADFVAAVKTDYAWVKSFFVKAPPAPVVPVTPANSNTA